jgi:hypothetical protein
MEAAMREHFDPAVWREAQRKQLGERRASGEVDIRTYLEALGEIERLYREMVETPESRKDDRSVTG